jgi:hypothetical protein
MWFLARRPTWNWNSEFEFRDFPNARILDQNSELLLQSVVFSGRCKQRRCLSIYLFRCWPCQKTLPSNLKNQKVRLLTSSSTNPPNSHSPPLCPIFHYPIPGCTIEWKGCMAPSCSYYCWNWWSQWGWYGRWVFVISIHVFAENPWKGMWLPLSFKPLLSFHHAWVFLILVVLWRLKNNWIFFLQIVSIASASLDDYVLSPGKWWLHLSTCM